VRNYLRHVNYNLIVAAERVRFQSDFSSAHWLHQVISMYERGMHNRLRREAFESVLRTAINVGCREARTLAESYPVYAGFPQYLRLPSKRWKETQQAVLADFDQHTRNRFGYMREGD
jgi:hypothetical protein